MQKEVFITKMPNDVSFQDFIEEIIVVGGYNQRSKEEVDNKLRDMGMDEAHIADAYYVRITVEVIE